MKAALSFVKRAQWLKLVFFFAIFVPFGVAISFFYNMVGTLYFGHFNKIAAAFLFGLVLMFFTDLSRKLLRIQSSLKLFYVVIAALLVIHFARWSLHVTWLRSFDFTVDGHHPLHDFADFAGYYWSIITESRLPAMHLVPDMFRFNDAGWVLAVYDFEIHLRGTLLAVIWVLEYALITGFAVWGVFLNKKLFVPGHCTWAKYVLLPYPFPAFTSEDIARLESGELEVITERTIAEGDEFSQVAIVYAGKSKTEYLAIVPSYVGKRGKVIHKKPKELVYVGFDEAEKIQLSLKETHAYFFERSDLPSTNPGIRIVEEIALSASSKDEALKKTSDNRASQLTRGFAFSETSSLVEGYKPVERKDRGRRQPNGTYKLP